METELTVSKQHRKDVAVLLSKNKDLFAKSDVDLRQPYTVMIPFDSGDYAPIKSRLYVVPLTKQNVINKAVDKVLKAKVIERL